ncbi:MAG TPA: hypothetical protein VFQ61_33190 [Polyangiaceae bacterium]|nr:hypothetical protein [Polyangiaceae bacterium]
MTNAETDPKQMLRSALTLARGQEPAAHDELLLSLQSLEFLERLDSPAEYQMASKYRLRVTQILEALARNPAPTARHVLVELTASDVFLAHDERIIVLIRASVFLRPPAPPVVDFWDRHSQPDDGFTPTTIPVLVENGSPPALNLLESKLADPAHEDQDKISWFRTTILCHRNDLELLLMCERALGHGLPASLRPALVEVLFDYRPEEWFRPVSSYSPPPLANASTAALLRLQQLGFYALQSVNLDSNQRQAVGVRLREAQAELAARPQPPP